MKKSLPLSWQIDFKNEQIKNVLIRKKLIWFTTGKVESLDKAFSKIKLNEKPYFLIRGCSKEHLNNLGNKNSFKFLTGNEAVLKTSFPHFKKKSLQELIKRGKKKLTFSELNYNSELQTNFISFLKKTRHANKPQLQNLFLSELEIPQRFFVVSDFNGFWQGLISVTFNSDKKVHTELLLKNRKSPQGTMEFLIKSLFDKFAEEGINEISLGEVPFYNVNKMKLKFLERFFLIAGRTINFAYNSKGLYNFKNKFSPFWNETYIISNKKITLIDLWFLMKSTNLMSLITDRIKTNFSF